MHDARLRRVFRAEAGGGPEGSINPAPTKSDVSTRRYGLRLMITSATPSASWCRTAIPVVDHEGVELERFVADRAFAEEACLRPGFGGEAEAWRGIGAEAGVASDGGHSVQDGGGGLEALTTSVTKSGDGIR